MTWVCNKCTAPFSVGAPRCPEQTCRAHDAHEQGGDPAVNVYDAVTTTGIDDPGEAWSTLNEGVAAARDELYREGRETVTQTAGVTTVLTQQGEGELAERLGDVDVTYREPDGSLGLPDDQAEIEKLKRFAAEARRNPVPVSDSEVSGSGTEVIEESGVSAGHEDTPDAGKAKSGTKARQKDVPS